MRNVRPVVLLPRNHGVDARAHHVITPLDQRLKVVILLQCTDESKMIVVVVRMLT